MSTSAASGADSGSQKTNTSAQPLSETEVRVPTQTRGRRRKSFHPQREDTTGDEFTGFHTLRSDQGQPVLVHRETALLTGAALPGLQRPPGTVATHDRCCGRRGMGGWMGSPREGGTADLLGIPCDTARRPRTAACAALTAPLLSITRTLCPPHRPPLHQMSL